MDLEERLNHVDYSAMQTTYRPSQFAFQFINFIKLVNGGNGEENKSPLIQYDMLDQLVSARQNLFVSFRGSAKSSVLHEYMILYLATYGELPSFGQVNVGMYISDTMDNGVKSMRTNLEHRWNNSEFLQKYVPKFKPTDVRWEFTNIAGKDLCFRGFGASALPLTTTLYTEDGTNTTIGAVRVGDRIYGADGKLCTVKIKSERFNRPVYRITLVDGRTLDVCEEHINNVIFRKSGRKEYEFREENLTTKDLLKRKLYATRSNRNTEEHVAYIKNTAAIDYPIKDLVFDPYTLGLLLGDGSIKSDGSVVLHCHKYDLPTYLANIPYSTGSHYLDKRNNNVYSVSLLGVHKRLETLGLRGIGTQEKFIPVEYFTSSIEQRKNLLAGLLDTDGCVTKTGRIEFVSTSVQLATDVARLAVTLGGSSCVRPAFIKGKHNDNNFDRHNAYKAELWLDCNDIVKLPRKVSRLSVNKERKRWIKRTKMVAIESITSIEQVPTQCIGVDSDDHLFLAGDSMVVTHNTGVRGFKEYGQRPTWAGFDDLMSDKNAESSTITRDIKHIIYKAARQALHPSKRMIVWTGTPFNKSDPLYEAAGSKAWNARVYPIAEKFPCTREEFKGGWEDRFSYDFVKGEYDSLLESGEVQAFNQELMLRVTSDEDRLVQDDDIVWYNRSAVLKDRSRFNFYITTDFATSSERRSDFSVISVWAITNNGEWLLVDGMCKRQLMDENINELFRFCSAYKPLSVGIEINGQQKGFISWIKGEMLNRNIFFNLAKQGSVEGIRRTGKKIDNFKLFVPTIKAKKLWLPEEMRDTDYMMECVDELRYATNSGFKSKHDDVCDTFSMLLDMEAYKPGKQSSPEYVSNEAGTFAVFNDDHSDVYKNSTVF